MQTAKRSGASSGDASSVDSVVRGSPARVVAASDFQAAGLYDPTAPRAADRLALLDWLTARGVTLEQMVDAHPRRQSLSGLAGDLALRPRRRITARQIAERRGMRVEDVLTLSLAAGLSPRSADEPVYTEDDFALFATFAVGATMFGDIATRRFTRVVGSSLARIAEAAVSLFQVNVEQAILDAGGSELALAQQNLRAIESLKGTRGVLHILLSAHIETANRRLREARPERAPDTPAFAVGFIDLVGFTTLAQNMASRELAAVIESFEEAAYDIVAAHDGRVVKLIGDEVMFVTRDAGAACDIALALLERFADDRNVTPRGALTYGEVLVRSGDYYGPIVNLASRVAQIAVPNELLVTPELAARAEAQTLRFEPAGRRMLKGLDEPATLLSLRRADR